MWAQGELETSGAPSTVNDVIEMAGGRNVCGHIRQEHTVVNLENLIAWRPDVIVMWHNPRKSPQDIISMPVWQSLPASKNRRVHELPSVFFCDLWTLKCLHAVKLIAGWCHPQAFGTFQLDSEKRSMLCDLYGKEIGERIPLEE
jgi:iron complex transport system substrate-binding protein